MEFRLGPYGSVRDTLNLSGLTTRRATIEYSVQPNAGATGRMTTGGRKRNQPVEEETE